MGATCRTECRIIIKKRGEAMSIIHRTAKLEDLSQIVAIYNSTIPSRMVTADTTPVSVGSRMTWFEEHNGHRPLWVIEQENRIAAWLSFSNFYGRPAYSRTAELSIYVHEEFRYKGFGSYLLSQALNEASALEVETLLGFIFGHNHPSLELFTKFGFSRWGELPAVAMLDGIERDLIIVGRRVKEAKN
jgi:phosphinothricin acetyltransferase